MPKAKTIATAIEDVLTTEVITNIGDMQDTPTTPDVQEDVFDPTFNAWVDILLKQDAALTLEAAREFVRYQLKELSKYE